MKIEEAIVVLSREIASRGDEPPNRFEVAEALCLESAKRLIDQRNYLAPRNYGLLPSETQEENEIGKQQATDRQGD